MPRVLLAEQPSYDHRCTLGVRFTDTNQGGHLATEALVGLLQHAREQALREIGFSALGLGAEHVGLVVADLAVNFRREAAAFDRLDIECHAGDFGTRSFRFFYRITCNGELLALAETGLVCFDYAVRQPVPIPPPFLRALKEHQG
jgi:YbgC/YbaW family acyl-CoA thioester hydrolase